jgi:hypothetical protein
LEEQFFSSNFLFSKARCIYKSKKLFSDLFFIHLIGVYLLIEASGAGWHQTSNNLFFIYLVAMTGITALLQQHLTSTS